MSLQDQPRSPIHATCVALNGRALLILGKSGSGKSTLALQMLGLGAMLVADDQVVLSADGSRLFASAPPALRGLIEARGVGLLRAHPVDAAEVTLVADLDTAEAVRLPPPRSITMMGCTLPLVLGAGADHLCYALLQYLKGGRRA